MKNPLVSKFLETIKKSKPLPTPKFKVGDVITNVFQGKRIVSEVIKVELIPIARRDDNFSLTESLAENISFEETINWNGPDGQYHLIDLMNEHSTLVNKKPYKRYRPIQNIDAKYDKMNPDTARILYGKSQESK